MADLYLLMVEVQSGPQGTVTGWLPQVVNGKKMMERGLAEATVQRLGDRRRFLMYAGDDDGNLSQAGESFGGDDPRPLAIMEKETIWNYGEPASTDLVLCLRRAAAYPIPGGSTPSPRADLFPVGVDAATTEAINLWGEHERHEIEAAFDRIVMELGGIRHADPPFYHVPFEVMGFRNVTGDD